MRIGLALPKLSIVRRKRERRELHDVMQEAYSAMENGVSRTRALLRAATRMHYEYAWGSFHECQKLMRLRK